jgi:hypothetical protein
MGRSSSGRYDLAARHVAGLSRTSGRARFMVRVLFRDTCTGMWGVRENTATRPHHEGTASLLCGLWILWNALLSSCASSPNLKQSFGQKIPQADPASFAHSTNIHEAKSYRRTNTPQIALALTCATRGVFASDYIL